jgi:uncharacterized protein YndB with AHSA1/START domain
MFIREREAGMAWVLRIVVVLGGLVLVVLAIGFMRPKSHTARTRSKLAAAPDVVWAALSDYERWAEWNAEIRNVERLPDRDGRTVLLVEGSWGKAPTTLAVWEPPNRLVTDMGAGGFSGRWTWELSPSSAGGTVLTITEEGVVGNPLFRAMMMLHDNHATMMGYHRALAKRLGEVVEPEKVEVAAAR